MMSHHNNRDRGVEGGYESAIAPTILTVAKYMLNYVILSNSIIFIQKLENESVVRRNESGSAEKAEVKESRRIT